MIIALEYLQSKSLYVKDKLFNSFIFDHNGNLKVTDIHRFFILDKAKGEGTESIAWSLGVTLFRMCSSNAWVDVTTLPVGKSEKAWKVCFLEQTEKMHGADKKDKAALSELVGKLLRRKEDVGNNIWADKVFVRCMKKLKKGGLSLCNCKKTKNCKCFRNYLLSDKVKHDTTSSVMKTIYKFVDKVLNKITDSAAMSDPPAVTHFRGYEQQEYRRRLYADQLAGRLRKMLDN